VPLGKQFRVPGQIQILYLSLSKNVFIAAWQPHPVIEVNRRRSIMKITLGFKVRGFILAAAFSAGLGFGTSASAQEEERPYYLIDLNKKTVTGLGTFNGGYASAINDAGQVVGA
jgi:hypothetical protein